MATEALLRSSLVRRALASSPLPMHEPGERSHVRQTTVARAYHETLHKRERHEIEAAYLEELARGPAYKRIRRGSIYGHVKHRQITVGQFTKWLAAILGAPRKPRGLKAPAGAPPPITANAILVADYIGWLSTKPHPVILSAKQIRNAKNMRLRTVERAVATLAAWGFIKIVHRRDKHHTGFQMSEHQVENQYLIILTRTPPNPAVS